MKIRTMLVKIWAYGGMLITASLVLFLFIYVFYKGSGTISWEFLSQPPKGAVLGEEGGIWPAIAGSLCFTGTAVVLGGIPAAACALYLNFYCRSSRLNRIIQEAIQCISGIPSIVLGLFAYSFLVKGLGWGRCILSASTALAIMILPFIEVRAEKAFREIDKNLILSSYALGCPRFYTIWNIVLPACRGELVSGMILGGCYAMGATAPLIFTGAVAYSGLPTDLRKPAMALPMHLYLLVAQGETSMDMAYGTAFVMMALILAGSLAATIYARRSQKKWNTS